MGENEPIFYAQKVSIKNGAAVHSERYGTYSDMLYQFYLYCANSVRNTDGNYFDAVEFGSIEGGRMKREEFKHDTPVEPEAEE